MIRVGVQSGKTANDAINSSFAPDSYVLAYHAALTSNCRALKPLEKIPKGIIKAPYPLVKQCQARLSEAVPVIFPSRGDAWIIPATASTACSWLAAVGFPVKQSS